MGLRHHAWWLLLAPLALNALTGPWLVSSGENGDEQIVGVLLTTFCVLAILVAMADRRSPSRLLRNALWTVPASFGGTASVMILGGVAGLGGYYAAIAVLSALGLVLMPPTDAVKE